MAMARLGNKVKSKLGFLIYGTFGSRKSSLCLDFARMKREDGKPFRVLYIDGESGSIDTYLDQLEEEGIDPSNTYIVYTQSLSEVREYIKKASNNEDFYELDDEGNETEEIVLDTDGEPFRVDAIVVDGTSVIYMATQQGLVEFSKKRARVRANKNQLVGEEKIVAIEGASIEIKDYNTLKFKGQDLILDLLASGKHFAVTARETDEKESMKDSEGKFVSVPTGNKIPEGFKGLDYNVKTVLYTFIDEDGTCKALVKNKDRTLVHMQNEIIEDPTLLDWEVVIHKNKGKKDFVIANNLKDSVDRENQKYEEGIRDFANEKEDNKGMDLNSPEYYHKAIAESIEKLPAMKKKSLKAMVTKEGLPLKFEELQDIEQLKKYLEIVSQ